MKMMRRVECWLLKSEWNLFKIVAGFLGVLAITTLAYGRIFLIHG